MRVSTLDEFHQNKIQISPKIFLLTVGKKYNNVEKHIDLRAIPTCFVFHVKSNSVSTQQNTDDMLPVLLSVTGLCHFPVL
jgi:hypothetical protein